MSRRERAERVRQRAEGKAFAAELDAAAGEDARAGRAGALGRLFHEPCLPDTRLAAQEHDGGRSRDRGLERRRQRGELGLPADEERTDQVPAHPRAILSGSRRRVRRGCQQAVISSVGSAQAGEYAGQRRQLVRAQLVEEARLDGREVAGLRLASEREPGAGSGAPRRRARRPRGLGGSRARG
jgi:hypothetical protein